MVHTVLCGRSRAVLTVLSVVAGWWLARADAAALRRITTTAQRLSSSNPHERIALTGPDDELRELADTFDAMLARLERSVDRGAPRSE